MRLPVVGQLVGRWETDPLWARVYDATVGDPRVGEPLWRLVGGGDLSPGRSAAAALLDVAAGARVLDLPCGGGTGVRGLRRGQGVDYVAADISAAMLRRTARVAADLGVADQVTTESCDVGSLPHPDGSFDLVLTLMGLHCFDDPRRAVTELTRVLAPGGTIVGSSMVTDSGLRHEPGRRIGRAIDVLGPMCSRSELHGWLRAGGVGEITMRTSGAFVHFRGTRRA